MKNKLIALSLIAATALSLAPKPAQASDKGLAVLGGFIGGVLVASELNNHNRGGYYAPSAPAVVVNDRYDYGYRDDGCWQEVAVRVYVPGCWVTERGFYGRDYRHYVGAHYENRTNRVWVSNRHDDRHDDRGRHDDNGHRR